MNQPNIIVILGFIVGCAGFATLADGIDKTGGHPSKTFKKSDVTPPPPFRMIEQLREKNPEEVERLAKLKDKDPEAFKSELRKLFKKNRNADNRSRFENPRSDEKVQELIAQYQDAENEEERETLKTKLKNQLETLFEERMKQHEQMLEAMSRRLEHMRKRLDKRREHKGAIIQHELEQLTVPPELRW